MAQQSDLPGYAETARPVLFERADSEYPYWGVGSSVLLANSRYYYWATAAHVVSKLGGSPDSLRIFPSDYSRISLPFNEQYTINLEDSDDDEEYKDIIMLRIDLDEFTESGDAPLAAQDIDLGILPAEELHPEDELRVIGYPGESNYIEYETAVIQRTRSMLRAFYVGPSASRCCHQLRVETSVSLSDYCGMSGSPVFYMQDQSIGDDIVRHPMLVGILLRGSASSSIMHLVSANVLVEMVRSVEQGIR